MNRKTYKVTTTHPTGYMNGVHEVEVTENYASTIDPLAPKTRYCSATGLGCSRDYGTKDDAEAIRRFLGEHGMTAVSIIDPTAKPKRKPKGKKLNTVGLFGIYTKNGRDEWILVAAVADKRDALIAAINYRLDYFKVEVRKPTGEVIPHDKEADELA